MCFFSIDNIIDIDIILWPCGNSLGDAFSMTSYAGVVKKLAKENERVTLVLTKIISKNITIIKHMKIGPRIQIHLANPM